MAKYQSIARANEFIDELHGRINRLDDWLRKERQKTKDLVAQLTASQAEVGQLRGLLWEFTPDEDSFECYNEDGECRFCGTSSLLKKPPYPHTADCLVTRARALLTPPAAPEADTSATEVAQ